MSNTVIRVEHLSKEYQKGVIGYHTLREQMAYRLAKLRRRQDPNSLIEAEKAISNERFLALDDVSFEITKGETFGIIATMAPGSQLC